jgi:predicted transcriptional regulator
VEVDTAALAAALIPTIRASVAAVLGEDNAAQVDVIADDLASRLAGAA